MEKAEVQWTSYLCLCQSAALCCHGRRGREAAYEAWTQKLECDSAAGWWLHFHSLSHFCGHLWKEAVVADTIKVKRCSGCTTASVKAIMAAVGTSRNSRRMSLLCSQCGGTGLEVTPQLEQHSQSSLTCFSCRYFWINFGFMWTVQLFFFNSQLKFVLLPGVSSAE